MVANIETNTGSPLIMSRIQGRFVNSLTILGKGEGGDLDKFDVNNIIVYNK